MLKKKQKVTREKMNIRIHIQQFFRLLHPMLSIPLFVPSTSALSVLNSLIGLFIKIKAIV